MSARASAKKVAGEKAWRGRRARRQQGADVKALTSAQRKALEILRAHPQGLKAGDFAELMWPDSYMHQKVSNQGRGACRGKAAWLCGGAYLGKLCKLGVATWSAAIVTTGAYYLSPAGREALDATSLAK